MRIKLAILKQPEQFKGINGEAIVKSDCFLCILSLHVKYEVLEQNWPSAATAVAQDVRSQSSVFNSGLKMWKDADFQFCWDLTILNVFFLAQSRL